MKERAFARRRQACALSCCVCLVDKQWQQERHACVPDKVDVPDKVERGGGDEVAGAAGFECGDAADEHGYHEQ